jgi:hypothetical protein
MHLNNYCTRYQVSYSRSHPPLVEQCTSDNSFSASAVTLVAPFVRYFTPCYTSVHGTFGYRHSRQPTSTTCFQHSTIYLSQFIIMDHIVRSSQNYRAPTPARSPFNSPESLRETMPPIGPSLQPPTKFPPIQMAGTEVRPTTFAISARIAFPSSS